MYLSNDIKQAALVGLRHRREELAAQILELERELSGSRDGLPAPRKRRRLSASARKRIAAAQRKRWAAVHAKQKAAAAKRATIKTVRKKAALARSQ